MHSTGSGTEGRKPGPRRAQRVPIEQQMLSVEEPGTASEGGESQGTCALASRRRFAVQC